MKSVKNNASFFLLFVPACFCMLFFTAYAKAQDDTALINTPPGKIIAARVMYGSIVVHTKYVANTRGANPRAGEIEISTQHYDSATWRKCYCFPRSGWQLHIADLDTRILGRSYSASYFIEPNYRLSSNASFFVKGGLGVSYLTNPFDSTKNPENHTYSLPVNFFLYLGTGISYNISKRLSIEGMINFEHNSNGDLEQPNRGINWYAASLGVRYNTGSNILPKFRKQTDKSWKNEKPFIEAGIFYSPKGGYDKHDRPERKFVAGATVQVTKKVSIINAVSVAAEVYYDDALASAKRWYYDTSSSVFAGLLIGHEFIFRKFIFSQQLGVYVFKNTSTYSVLNQSPIQTLYHRWGLTYKVSPHWYAGINFLAHKQVADFVDARLMYRF